MSAFSASSVGGGLGEGPCSPTTITFTAHGKPAAQGSKIRTKYALRDSNDTTLTPWRNTVSNAAHQARLDNAWPTGTVLPRLDTDLTVRCTFYFDRPRAHYRTGKNAHLLKDDAPTYPRRVGDIDKLQRALLDAITDSGLWIDDAQVVRVVAEKRWTGEGMSSPGVTVQITPAVQP